MHIMAHISDCQLLYSLGFTEGVGQSSGESVEHPWAEENQSGCIT